MAKIPGVRVGIKALRIIKLLSTNKESEIVIVVPGPNIR